MKNENEKAIEVIIRAINGDTAAFEELYAEYAQTILFHVRNLIVDKENYEDVSQEVVLELFTNIKSLKEPRAFRSWMHRVVKYTCIDHNKVYLNKVDAKTIANGEEALAAEITFAAEDNPEQSAMMSQTSEQLFNLISALPTAYRETIILRYYDGLSYKEIAKAFDISVSTVSTNLLKAKKRLKKMMYGQEKEWRPNIGSGAAALSGMAAVDLKSAIASGVNQVFPAESVKHFIDSTNASLVFPHPPASGHAVNAGKTANVSHIMAGACVSLAVCIGAGGFAAAQINDSAIVESTAPAKTEYSQQIIKYAGDPHIAFQDASGTNTNPAGISVSDSKVKSFTAAFAVTSDAGTVIFSGTGDTVGADAGLNTLPDGLYKVIFTLTDGNGSVCEISRPFKIAKSGYK